MLVACINEERTTVCYIYLEMHRIIYNLRIHFQGQLDSKIWFSNWLFLLILLELDCF